MAVLRKAHIEEIMPNAQANGLDREWDVLLKTLVTFEINTKNRIAAFIMNVAKESGELYYVEEIADGWAYEGRCQDLGNCYDNDGPTYKGHGYIQITGRKNHRAVGQGLGVDFEANPLLLTQLPYTWLSAGWYWRNGSSWGDLNDYADDGDYESTILGVRGGPDTDREHYWWTAMDVLPDDVTLPKESKPKPDPTPEPKPDEWPTVTLAPDKIGWLVDDKGNYARTPVRPDTATQGRTDEDGWWYVVRSTPVPEPVKWEWPEANDEPIPGGWYWQEWPTRYNWSAPKSTDGLDPRPDVEKWARYLIDKYPGQVWVNTYYCHPPDLLPERWDRASMDVWAYDGRGTPIPKPLGDEIHSLLFNDPNKPDIRHTIWQGWMWHYTMGWVWWGDHFDHIHVSYLVN